VKGSEPIRFIISDIALMMSGQCVKVRQRVRSVWEEKNRGKEVENRVCRAVGAP
jgi:hypothetical protein